MPGWTAADLPSQAGRTFVITGANSGIGLAAARELARVGATVVLACRDVEKGRAAARALPGDVDVRALDLADLASVRRFAAGVDAPIDVLVNNAGVMAVPQRRTPDGFELQLATNHLGPFALTGLLLPWIGDRVVTVSSFGHRMGRIAFDDLQTERPYRRWKAYTQSKLANLLFMFELQRRLEAAGSFVRSLAVHPGYAATNLQFHTESVQDQVMALANRLFAQSAEHGAWPTLLAATADLPGGSFVGPGALGGMRGHPRLETPSAAARDPAVAARLWDVSEQLTGITYTFAAAA
jgi:NAD(P)-dependent dehydrogenase (short-subunit alcohol dehydrogenase family)